jgi:hypothetical protein
MSGATARPVGTARSLRRLVACLACAALVLAFVCLNWHSQGSPSAPRAIATVASATWLPAGRALVLAQPAEFWGPSGPRRMYLCPSAPRLGAPLPLRRRRVHGPEDLVGRVRIVDADAALAYVRSFTTADTAECSADDVWVRRDRPYTPVAWVEPTSDPASSADGAPLPGGDGRYGTGLDRRDLGLLRADALRAAGLATPTVAAESDGSYTVTRWLMPVPSFWRGAEEVTVMRAMRCLLRVRERVMPNGAVTRDVEAALALPDALRSAATRPDAE